MYEMEEMGEPLLSSIHESYPNPNPKHENDEPYLTANTKKKWNGNICDCFNNIYPTMICSFITPYVYISLMYEHVTERNFCYNNPLFIYLMFNVFGYFISIYFRRISYIVIFGSQIYMFCVAKNVRTNIRLLKNIPGSNCEDIFLTIFCNPCSLSQCGRTLYEYECICDNICDKEPIYV